MSDSMDEYCSWKIEKGSQNYPNNYGYGNDYFYGMGTHGYFCGDGFGNTYRGIGGNGDCYHESINEFRR